MGVVLKIIVRENPMVSGTPAFRVNAGDAICIIPCGIANYHEKNLCPVLDGCKQKPVAAHFKFREKGNQVGGESRLDCRDRTCKAGDNRLQPAMRAPDTPRKTTFPLPAGRPSASWIRHISETGERGSGAACRLRCRPAGHLLLHFLLHFLGSGLHLVRCDHPGIAIGIDDDSAAISPEHIHHGALGRGAEP